MPDEIIHWLVKEIEQGKELDKVMTGLREEFGDELNKVSGYFWNTSIGKAEAEAYEWCLKDKALLPMEYCTVGSRTSPVWVGRSEREC